ncbi:hypothetical protein MMC09_004397 [Bachmanniomyces sp. S44760]|nr:hypothetical protein [Bachmanniomyces sp. S44760]
MSDKDAGTPRVFLARHGETEWSKSGRFTGTTEMELTTHGIEQVVATSKMIIGNAKLVDLASLATIYVSPRVRAQQTFAILFEAYMNTSGPLQSPDKTVTTESLAEWGYGDYEGLLTKQIRELRRSRGLDQEREWNIWRDGCEGGETAQQVTQRCDELIAKIRGLQAQHMHGGGPADVMVIAHGHILRAFAKRWLGYPLDFPLSMMIEPAAIGILSYQHHNIEEPAFLLGMAFPASSD